MCQKYVATRWWRVFTFAITLAVSCLSGWTPAQAHELRPAIGELSRVTDTLVLSLRMNLEALVAGIPPEHDDTDEAVQAPDYERLRELSAELLRERALAWSATLLQGITLQAGDRRLPLQLETVSVPATGDVRVARDSFVTVSTSWPAGADTVRIGWQREFGALIVRAGADDAATFNQYLLPGGVSDPILLSVIGGSSAGGALDGASAGPGGAAAQSSRTALATFTDYVRVGFVHIVPLGLDHILFVVGLFLLAPRIVPIAWQVSVFTLAHSLTLAAGTLGWFTVPASIVEPLIALSIALVALENLVSVRLRASRLILVFGVGLLHGLGFAGVLVEAGLSADRFLLSLFAFNAGVEIGQLCVVAVCFALVGWFRDAPGYRRAVIVPGSLCIGAVGLFWFVQRLVG